MPSLAIRTSLSGCAYAPDAPADGTGARLPAKTREASPSQPNLQSGSSVSIERLNCANWLGSYVDGITTYGKPAGRGISVSVALTR